MRISQLQHKGSPMPLEGHLLAWIEPQGTGHFVGAFVGEGAAAGVRKGFAGRSPATHVCASPEQAQRWIEEQASALDLPVKWIAQPPRG
jgi:hypothetical protein